MGMLEYELRTMHLFAGAGGGLYADLILGHKPIVAVEWDPYACAVLRARADDGWFPGLHVWEGDVRLFDPSDYAGKVDCISAGFPCTDISTAGQGKGINGERSGLYREILRVADIVRPRYLFLENSPAITSRGLGQVLGELAERGYNARWTCLSAGEVGANHERNRWWALCEMGDTSGDTTRDNAGDKSEGGREETSERISPIFGRTENPIIEREIPNANNSEQRPAKRAIQKPEKWDDINWTLAKISNPNSAFVERDKRAQRGTKKRTNTIQPSWWESEPDVGRLAYGLALGGHQLKCLGNGQTPICAATAWKILGGP